MTRFDKKRNLVLIVMEILEDDPSAKSVIQDIFGQGEVGRFRPDLALDDMDVQKNIGKRANLMITDEKTKEMILDKMLYFAPNRQEEIKRKMMSINFRGVKRQPKVYKTVNRQYKTGSKMFELIDVLLDDLMWKDKGKLMGAEAFSFAIRFIYECMKAWEKDFEEDFRILFEEIEGAIEGFINMYRQWTPVGVVPKGSGFLQGAPPETQGAGYPGVKSILKAIEELETTTGLEARDMHDRNILVRPGSQELVIVDVGMFKQGAATKFRRGQPPKYEREVTAMEEAFPHAGNGVGRIRQDPKAERRGHVQRSCHQDLENVISGEDCDKMIEEELEAVLDEKSRCTKVTKKASSTRKGKKWMKCVKSDSGGYKRIHWGQKGVRVTGKSGNTKRKKSFKKRHGCSKAKSNTPKGQACKDWAE